MYIGVEKTGEMCYTLLGEPFCERFRASPGAQCARRARDGVAKMPLQEYIYLSENPEGLYMRTVKYYGVWNV